MIAIEQVICTLSNQACILNTYFSKYEKYAVAIPCIPYRPLVEKEFTKLLFEYEKQIFKKFVFYNKHVSEIYRRISRQIKAKDNSTIIKVSDAPFCMGDIHSQSRYKLICVHYSLSLTVWFYKIALSFFVCLSGIVCV